MSDKDAPSPWSYIRRLTPLPLRGWLQNRWPYLASLVVLSTLLGSLVLVERMITEPARPVTPTAEEGARPGGAPDNSAVLGWPEDLTSRSEVEATAPAVTPIRPVAGDVTLAYGWHLSRTFGDYRFHTGVDLGAPPGEPVQAAMAGKVTGSGPNDETGLTVLVQQADGSIALYGNLGTVAVEPGHQVQQGEVIGTVGTSNAAESAEPSHLHYEVLAGSEPVDPGLR